MGYSCADDIHHFYNFQDAYYSKIQKSVSPRKILHFWLAVLVLVYTLG